MRKVLKFLNLKMDNRKRSGGFFRLARLLLLVFMTLSVAQAERVSRLLNGRESDAYWTEVQLKS
jgi:hypothetical protein